ELLAQVATPERVRFVLTRDNDAALDAVVDRFVEQVLAARRSENGRPPAADPDTALRNAVQMVPALIDMQIRAQELRDVVRQWRPVTSWSSVGFRSEERRVGKEGGGWRRAAA